MRSSKKSAPSSKATHSTKNPRATIVVSTYRPPDNQARPSTTRQSATVGPNAANRISGGINTAVASHRARCQSHTAERLQHQLPPFRRPRKILRSDRPASGALHRNRRASACSQPAAGWSHHRMPARERRTTAQFRYCLALGRRFLFPGLTAGLARPLRRRDVAIIRLGDHRPGATILSRPAVPRCRGRHAGREPTV